MTEVALIVYYVGITIVIAWSIYTMVRDQRKDSARIDAIARGFDVLMAELERLRDARNEQDGSWSMSDSARPAACEAACAADRSER